MTDKRFFILMAVLALFSSLLASCSSAVTTAPVKITTTIPAVTFSKATQTLEPAPSATPTPTLIPDIGYAMVLPFDDLDLYLSDTPIDTWIDSDGMHVTNAGPLNYDSNSAYIHCSDQPYSTSYMEFVDTHNELDGIPQPEFGEFTQTNSDRTANRRIFFLEGNCLVAIYSNCIGIDAIDNPDQWMTQQTNTIAKIIEERLKHTTTENGIQFPTYEITPGLFDEVFNSVEIFRWTQSFRSYSVILDVKKPFIKKSTFGVYDVDEAQFVLRRQYYNYPPLGMELVDNIGQNVGEVEHPVHVMRDDGNYQLWIWIEDQLAAIYDLN